MQTNNLPGYILSHLAPEVGNELVSSKALFQLKIKLFCCVLDLFNGTVQAHNLLSFLQIPIESPDLTGRGNTGISM